jgi:uncharacterized repeat protein (TIGR01451 family)
VRYIKGNDFEEPSVTQIYKTRKEIKEVKTKVFFVLVMLAMLASLVVPFAASAQGGNASPPGANANGLNMNLAVIPTLAHNGDTLGYYITISNNPAIVPGLISADATNIVVTFSAPDATGIPGAPVTIATIPSLLVGESVSFNPGNTPALSVVLSVNPGVTVAFGGAHFSAELLTDPVSVATDTKDIPTNVIPPPCIDVTKTANPTTSKAGDTVTYTIQVCNCGNTTLTNVTVDDLLLGNLSASYADTLAPSACESHNFPRTVLATDPDPVVNTVTACGQDALALQVCDEDSASVDLVSPCMSVTKTVNPTVSKPGDAVTYTICVTNCGDIDLENLSLVDSLMGTLVFPSTIAAGAEICVDFPYTIPADASDPMSNCVEVYANPLGMTNDIIPDPDTSELCAEVDLVNPDICVTKTADPTEGEPGDTITYTINVCNCGDIDLENVYVIDDMLGNLSASYADTLAVGACESHEFTYIIKDTDPQMITNCVVVYGEPVGPLTNEVTDRDCAQVNVLKAKCRITGGGTIGDSTVRHGFELHCDIKQLPNRLEINWGNGEKFHLEKLNSATCFYDPLVGPPNPPRADCNTYVGSGTGRYDGIKGATAEWTFTDAGEPGGSHAGCAPNTCDWAKIKITDANGNVVLEVEGYITFGNQQFHNCTGKDAR